MDACDHTPGSKAPQMSVGQTQALSRSVYPDTVIIYMTFQIGPLYLMAGKLFMTAVSELTTRDTSS